jgi:hypothetical protein
MILAGRIAFFVSADVFSLCNFGTVPHCCASEQKIISLSLKLGPDVKQFDGYAATPVDRQQRIHSFEKPMISDLAKRSEKRFPNSGKGMTSTPAAMRSPTKAIASLLLICILCSLFLLMSTPGQLRASTEVGLRSLDRDEVDKMVVSSYDDDDANADEFEEKTSLKDIWKGIENEYADVKVSKMAKMAYMFG